MFERFSPSEDLKLRVSETIFNHIDGIAIGSSVATLKKRNVFEILRQSCRPIDARLLSRQVGGREGFFHVALRLLAHQGFLQLTGEMDAGQTEVSLTSNGRAWLNFLEYYEQIPKIAGMTPFLTKALSDQCARDNVNFSMPSFPSETRTSPIAKRVKDHLLGEITAVIMTGLYFGMGCDKFQSSPPYIIPYKKMSCDDPSFRFVSQTLRSVGWSDADGSEICLNDAGRLALEWTPQYFYPVSYLSTFRRVEQLVFGSGQHGRPCLPITTETHVDRPLDIKFSGMVYERTCRNALHEIVAPLFDRLSIEEQPCAIVDTGSGDGTLLVDLFRIIRANTLRGRHLQSYPIWVVGTEYSEQARETTLQALERAGISHCRAIYGDIADPTSLARDLSMIGVDPLNALHINKSVIHNRVFRPPRDTQRLKSWKSGSQTPFVSCDGALLKPREIECNLIELFEDWKPFTQRHGMIVIEAHTVNPVYTAPKVGRNIITCMDSTHGYSTQYLMEYEAFISAVRAAGYDSVAYRMLSGSLFGRPTMTINHFIQRNT